MPSHRPKTEFTKGQPRRALRDAGSFVLIAGTFFVLVMIALTVLLYELHSIQGRAHDFVKAHAQVGRIEEQLTLIEQVGEQNYLSQQIHA